MKTLNSPILTKRTPPTPEWQWAGIIREALIKAQKYGEAVERAMGSEEDMPEFDMKSEALLPVLRGEVKAHFHCHRADDIFTAIRIAKEFELDYVLIHCTDGHIIADELAEEEASCVIGPVICDRCKPEMANLTPANAGILSSHGIKVAICTDHAEVPIEYLPLSAAIAVKNGLDYEKGIEAITCTAAEIAGISDRVGSVKTGLDADLTLFSGDPLDVMVSPDMVICGGKII